MAKLKFKFSCSKILWRKKTDINKSERFNE